MRWARFAHDGRTAFGIVEGDRVAEVSGGLFDPPSPTGRTFAVDRIRLLPPVIPATFYAAGTNYRQHLQNAESRGELAYTLVDVQTALSEACLDRLRGINGVLSVRTL